MISQHFRFPGSRSSRDRFRSPAASIPPLVRFTSLLVVLALASSCATKLHPSYENDVLTHAVVVRASGTAVDPREALVKDWEAPKPPKDLDIDNQLEAIRLAIKAKRKLTNGPLKILVFVHGGLHSYAASCDTYRQLRGPMEEAGFYPIFVIWNSDLFSTYADRLTLVRQGEERRVLGFATAPIVLPVDLASALVRTPLVWANQLATDLRTTELPESPRAKDHQAVEDYLAKKLPAGLRAGVDRRTWLERGYYATTYAVTFPLKLASAPIIDGFGSKAWDMMLRRTQTMFHPPERVDVFATLRAERNKRALGTSTVGSNTTDEQFRQAVIDYWYENKPLDPASGHQRGPVGAMWEFSRWLRERSKEPDTEIHLYGHSMGTIVLNELLRQVPDLKVKQIGYLAAACSIRDWQESVVPYLQSKDGQDTKFYSVALHRMREQSERNPGAYLDITPRGSLLEWIDSFLANPTSISDRTLGSWENVLRVMPQFTQDHDQQPAESDDKLAHRIFLHCFDAAVMPMQQRNLDQPQKHGDFNDWRFWEPNFLWPKDNSDVPPRLDKITKPEAPFGEKLTASASN